MIFVTGITGGSCAITSSFKKRNYDNNQKAGNWDDMSSNIKDI